MTIITVRDGIMAVDSAVSRDDTIIGQIKKWREVPEFHGGGFISGAGSTYGVLNFLNTFKKTGVGAESGVEDCTFVHLKSDGNVWIFNSGWYQIDAEYSANGFGRQEAMGALAHGATAEEAARIVCDLVDSCGGKIHVLKV